MCLILFAYQISEKYPLILAANRDEFYHRPTLYAQFWPESPHLLAGKDLEAGGTWLGLTRKGRFAALTNFRDGQAKQNPTRSRGELTLDYLLTEKKPEEFSEHLQANSQNYAGFNLLFGNVDRLYYGTNRYNGDNSSTPFACQPLEPGLYGLSNHLLDTPWPKVEKGKSLLQKLIATPRTDQLIAFLQNREQPSDDKLPDTHVGLELERQLATMFIQTPTYGTRCSTALLIDQQGNATFHERSYPLSPEESSVDRRESFQITV